MALCRALEPEAGAPRIVEVVGEPGVGKTRLLVEALAAVDDGGTVIAGTADEGGWGAFAPLRDRLDDIGALAAEEASGHVTLVVDDIHLAAPPTEAALVRLLRRPPLRRVTVVLAHRPRQCPTRLLAAIGGSAGRWRHERLQIGPLSREETLSLVPEGVCARHRSSIHERSGGNPLHVRALAAMCRTAGCGPHTEPAPDPESLAPLVLEIESLPEPTRSVAHAAAVLSGPFPADLLARVADVAPSAALTAVGELVDADVLRPNVGPRGFVYRHPVLRQAAYESAPVGARLAAHQRAAIALRAAGRPVTEYAEHLIQSEDDDSVREHLLDAAGKVEATDPGAAARWYENVLDRLGDGAAHRARRLTAAVGLTRAYTTCGRIGRARVFLDDAEALLDPAGADAEYETELIELRAVLAQMAGRYTEARSVLRTGIRRSGTRNALRLRTALAATSLWDTGWDWSDGAVLSAVCSADPATQTVVLGVHATNRLAHGDVETAGHSAAEAARVLESQSDGQLSRRPEALTHLGWVETHLDACDAAIRHLARGLSVARRGGRHLDTVPMLVGLGACRLRQGRVAEALSHTEEAVRLAESAEAADLIAMSLTARARVWLADGAVLAALADAQRAGNEVSPDSPWWRHSRIIHGEARLAGGDADAAVAALLDGAGGGLSESPVWDHPAVAELLCRAESARNDHEAAAAWAAWATDAAERLGTARGRCLADLAHAAAARRPTESLVHALDAIAVGGGALTCSLEAGRAHAVAARALLELRDPDSARRHADRLASVAERTGAGSLAGLSSALRAEIARTEDVWQPPEEERYQLSQREFEIAGLVSQGRTNRQIARQLGMSHKTVETHLGRIFGKLEVSSRTEIAAMMGRSQIGVRPFRRRARETSAAE